MRSNIAYQIFRVCTTRLESTRSAGLLRILLGVTAILFPYPVLTLYQPWAWITWILYYLAGLGLFSGILARTSSFTLGILLLAGAPETLRGLSSLQMQGHALGIYLLLGGLLPLHMSYSTSRFLKRIRGQKPQRERGNLWAMSLLRIQASVFLLIDGVSRLQPAFFNGSRIEQILLFNLGQSDPTPFLKYSGTTALLGIASVCLPIVGALLLWIPRYRMAGACCVLLYGLLLQLLLPQTLWFLLILVGLVPFLNPVWLHRIPDLLKPGV